MEAFGIMGFIFGLGALGKIIMLEEQLKESGVLKEKTDILEPDVKAKFLSYPIPAAIVEEWEKVTTDKN